MIYRDDFAQSHEKYSEESGQLDENGDQLFKNTDSNGRFHSDWCSMIYSRLMLVRNMFLDDSDGDLIAYFEIGRLIVEEEQIGGQRAAYGKYVIPKLSQYLTVHLGRGFSVTNPKQMRTFYQVYAGD